MKQSDAKEWARAWVDTLLEPVPFLTILGMIFVVCAVMLDDATAQSGYAGGGDRRRVILSDRARFDGRLSPIGGLQVDEPYRLAGVPFEGATVDSNFWAAINSGAASAAGQTGSVATVTSGTANSGYGQMSSVQKARFMFAHAHLYRAAIRVPDVTEAGVTRRWGAFSVSTVTPQNGTYFELDEAGALSVVCITGGTPTATASGSFNGDTATDGANGTYTVDANVHAYEIAYFTTGAWFFIDDVLIHELIPTTAPFSVTSSVPITSTAVNSAGGTESGSLETWNAIINRMGRAVTSPTSHFHAVGQTAGTVLKRGPGEVHLVTLSAISVNSVVTLYDNTAASGTILWTSGAMPAQAQPFSVGLGMPFQTGLTLVVSAADAGATVVYE